MELPLPALGAAEFLTADEAAGAIVALAPGRGAIAILSSTPLGSPAFFPSVTRAPGSNNWVSLIADARFCESPSGRVMLLATAQLNFVTLSVIDIERY